MPARIQSSKILPHHGMEYLVLVSDLGVEHHLALRIADSDSRQQNIDAALALLDDNDAATVAYAKQHSLPAPEVVTR